MRIGSKNRWLLTAALALSGFAAPVFQVANAVVPVAQRSIPFTKQLTAFRSALNLPVSDAEQTITIPAPILKQRISQSPKNKTIEPLSLQVPVGQKDMDAFALRMAKPGKATHLLDYLHARVTKAPTNTEANGDLPVEGHRAIILDDQGLALIDAAKLSAVFAKNHHHLTVATSQLKPDTPKGRSLIEQMRPFLSAKDLKHLTWKLWMGQSLSVDTDLLPIFARRMVKKFIAYRGPNCFHAALAFQTPALTSSALVNVKEEEGYHRAMINYDELWRILNLEFYEVDPAHAALKYGDVVVFFDVPKTGDTSNVSYRWIRHTAAYLFNGYTFSKGSKSPNTPYTVKTLDEEWATWKRYTNNMGVKIFRRSEVDLPKRPPKDLNEWLY